MVAMYLINSRLLIGTLLMMTPGELRKVASGVVATLGTLGGVKVLLPFGMLTPAILVPLIMAPPAKAKA